MKKPRLTDVLGHQSHTVHCPAWEKRRGWHGLRGGEGLGLGGSELAQGHRGPVCKSPCSGGVQVPPKGRSAGVGGVPRPGVGAGPVPAAWLPGLWPSGAPGVGGCGGRARGGRGAGGAGRSLQRAVLSPGSRPRWPPPRAAGESGRREGRASPTPAWALMVTEQRTLGRIPGEGVWSHHPGEGLSQARFL